jgi:hypothetical protein
MLDAQNAALLPHRCCVDSWDPHGVPEDLLIEIVAFVYVMCKNSENVINLDNLSKKIIIIINK